MRTLILIVLAVSAAASNPSIADAPPANATAPAAKPSVSDESKAPATEPNAAAKTEPQAQATDSEQRAFKPPPGFKAKILDWGIVYCKKMPVLGSRFPKDVCMSEAELKEYLANNDAMRRDKDQASRICTGACNP
jgi:hypothetical protein